MSALASYLPALVFVAGLGQLALIAASLAIPRVLRWREDIVKLRPLTRQVFWTYAVYIWCTNLAFGLLSLRPDWLLDRSPLVLPLPILFHPPFLRGVVWPLIDLR